MKAEYRGEISFLDRLAVCKIEQEFKVTKDIDQYDELSHYIEPISKVKVFILQLIDSRDGLSEQELAAFNHEAEKILQSIAEEEFFLSKI